MFAIEPEGAPGTPRSGTPVAVRSVSSCSPTAGSSSATASSGCSPSTPAPATIETLATEADGRPLLVCNNAAVAADGTIYFSDSSAVHPLSRWRADLVEDTRTGRLLRRNPDGSIDTLLEGLAFANGVALSADESACSWPRRPAAPSYACG